MIARNGDPAQGRYCVSPEGRIVYHEASQRTKPGWRECEESDIPAFTEHLLIHCGRKAPPPTPAAVKAIPQLVKVQATGTVTDGPPE